jgi:hypothetical protein
MSLDYHLVDPLGDDEKDEQQSDVPDGCWSGGFGLKSWTRSAKSCQQIANPSNPAWRPMRPENGPPFLSLTKIKMPSNLRPNVQFPCQTRTDHRSVWTDIGWIQPTNQHNNCSTRLAEVIGMRS